MSSMGQLKKNNSKLGNDISLGNALISYCFSATILIYLFLMLCVFPLYYNSNFSSSQGGYMDMGDSKYNFFMYVSIFVFAILIILFVIWGISNIGNNKVRFRLSLTDFFVIAFLIITFFSYVHADQGIHQLKVLEGYEWDEILGTNVPQYKIVDVPLNGYPGWYMGLFAQTTFFLAYYFISRFWKWSNIMLYGAMTAGLIASVIAILMRFNFDPLGLYSNIPEASIVDTKEKFISTLGQTSWYSSYAILIMGVAIVFYFMSHNIAERVFSALCLCCGAGSIVTVNSDSAFVALPLILVFIFWYSFESNEKFARMLEIVTLILMSFRIIGLLQDLFPSRKIEFVSETDSICQFLNHSSVTLILFVFFAILTVAFNFYLKCNSSVSAGKRTEKNKDADKKSTNGILVKKEKFNIGKIKVLRNVAVIMAIVVIWAVAMLMILVSTGKINAFSDVAFLKFNDIWGNFRGFNWRMALKGFSSGNFKEILIGVGPDSFFRSMQKYCSEEVDLFWNGNTLACAHNEFLNMLVTEGILGLVAYVGTFISAIARFAKHAYKDSRLLVPIVVIVAYMGHNFFCYQTCVCTPILFIFIGIGEGLVRSKMQENAGNSNN